MEVIVFRVAPSIKQSYSHLPQGGPDDYALAKNIWADEIKQIRDSFPISVLQKTINFQGKQYTFSILDSGFQHCIPPGNGKYMVDMYSTCPLKIGRIDEKTLETSLVVKNDYCFLLEGKTDRTNETQFLWDKKNRTAYFRIIQHGVPVPACNRAIQLH